MTKTYKTTGSSSEWLNSSEVIRSLLRNNQGLYALLETNWDSRAEIVQIKNREVAETCMIRTGSLEEALAGIYKLRERTAGELGERRRNPVKEEVKWWSTGEVMNRREIEYDRQEKIRLSGKLKKAEEILSQLEQGAYEIRPVRDYADL